MDFNIRFSRINYWTFIISAIFLLAGFLCMKFDHADNGFGILTLWIAPPLLATGFILPAFGIVGHGGINRLFQIQNLSKNKLRHISGLVVFLISLSVYIKTLEPTASLWDCAEFIAAAYKLQIPHTPGAPLFLLTGRIFTLFSFGNTDNVAWLMNLMSAFFSSLAVYFIFHIIYHFSKRISGSGFLPILAANTGGLCLAFSDTFWFSAVEAETYGAAAFFLVLLVWMGIKANKFQGELYSRWLILIFYVTGLSFCVHPMCLLSLPPIAVSLFFKNKALPLKNILAAIATGFMILLFINRFVAVGLFEWAFKMDLLLVNFVGLPFYSGAILLLIIVIFGFVLLLKKYPRAAAFTWSAIFLLIGFTPYLMLFIRSGHNPPMDEGNPENLTLIKAYMNRESYGTRPLVYGPYFDAQIEDIKIQKKIYYQNENQYEVAGSLPDYQYETPRSALLPRMYSRKKEDIEVYCLTTGLKPGEKPSFTHNIIYLVKFQLGHMYFRYLMWNFAGRQSDHQDAGWLRPWEKPNLSGEPSIKNKARNQLWMIPFALGLVGMLFQYRKDKVGFLITALFFLITGLILALYLNSPPNEPRERDYIYVGSFMAYSIWIGLGIIASAHLIGKILSSVYIPYFVAFMGIALPSWMFYQNYDDHNRSGRTFQIDNARHVLNSCARNAILFTGGDNDTFPLWYLQEVEGFRTDVRIVVLSYFNTDWYINQLRKAFYQSAPFSLTLEHKDYRQYGPNDVLYIQKTEEIKGAVDAEKYLNLLNKEHPALKVNTRFGDSYHILPSDQLSLKIDTTSVFLRHPLPPGGTLTNNLVLRVKQEYLEKNGLAFIDVILSNGWQRPIYFNFTSANNIGLDIHPYLIQEGLVFRFLPVKADGNKALIDKDLMYENLVENADYSNIKNGDVYFNFEDYHARIFTPVKQCFNILTEEFIKTGEKDMAVKTMKHALGHLYEDHLIPSFAELQAANLLMALQMNEESKTLCKAVFAYYFNQIEEKINENKSASISQPEWYLLKGSANMLDQLGESGYNSVFEKLVTSF